MDIFDVPLLPELVVDAIVSLSLLTKIRFIEMKSRVSELTHLLVEFSAKPQMSP